MNDVIAKRKSQRQSAQPLLASACFLFKRLSPMAAFHCKRRMRNHQPRHDAYKCEVIQTGITALSDA